MYIFPLEVGRKTSTYIAVVHEQTIYHFISLNLRLMEICFQINLAISLISHIIIICCLYSKPGVLIENVLFELIIISTTEANQN
jgi:hypothetical protein